jgi:predicted RNA-binding protein
MNAESFFENFILMKGREPSFIEIENFYHSRLNITEEGVKDWLRSYSRINSEEAKRLKSVFQARLGLIRDRLRELKKQSQFSSFSNRTKEEKLLLVNKSFPTHAEIKGFVNELAVASSLSNVSRMSVYIHEIPEISERIINRFKGIRQDLIRKPELIEEFRRKNPLVLFPEALKVAIKRAETSGKKMTLVEQVDFAEKLLLAKEIDLVREVDSKVFLSELKTRSSHYSISDYTQMKGFASGEIQTEVVSDLIDFIRGYYRYQGELISNASIDQKIMRHLIENKFRFTRIRGELD